MSSIRNKKTASVFRCQSIRKQWKGQVEIHFGGSAVILLWRSYRHQAITIDSSMPTDAFLVFYSLLWENMMGIFHFPCFSKICSESNGLKADQWIHQPPIWPTSEVLAMMSVPDFISQISSTSTWGPNILFQTSYCKYWCAFCSQRNYDQVFTRGRKKANSWNWFS